MRVSRFRAGAVAIVAAVAVVVPAVSASAVAKPVNRPPVVSEAGIVDPVSSCAVGAARPTIRSTTPTLRAVLRDPEGTSSSATFGILDSRGRIVWGPTATAAQASGAAHSVRVPAGRLADGGTYTWVVSGRDASGHWALPRLCQFTVDSVAPAVPSVTPVAGEPAVYVEGATSGGTGLRGSFTLSDTSDVVSYVYGFSGAASGSVPAATPTIAYTPTAPGPQTLSVQAVDAAGNVSDARIYTFTVASPVVTGGGRWLLDEGAGAVGAEAAGGASLALTPSTGWTGGPLAELANRPTDRALLLDSVADGAQTVGSVVNTGGTFTAVAFARLDATGTSGTVLSQDGTSTSAFTLGYTSEGCAAGVAACWSFALPTSDSAAAPQAVVRSAAAVEPGSWVELTGVHNATTGAVSLFVCTLGSAAKPGSGVPVASGPVAFTTPWSASGPLLVGQAFGGAAPFAGAVGSVRVLEGVAQTVTDVRRSCAAGTV